MPDTKLINKLVHLLVSAQILFCMLSLTVHAEEKAPLDTVVIMDSSGSMKQTDPKQLRKPAAKLFISLLSNEDKLSVVSFSSQAWPITFLTQLNSERKISKALRATDKISHKGIHTNIHSAISKGIELLKKSDQLNREPIIILMSDGQMDVGNKKKSAQLRQQIFDDLLPQLIEHNIKIYSIAFTEQSDQALLQEIAETTDGRYALAASDDVLHKVFSKIFEQTKEPDMLPLNENKFVVDDSIKEVTIIANKASDTSLIYLQQPDGKKINSTFKSEKIKWFTSTSFDMITIKEPEKGEWKILFSDDDNRAYIVTDIKLRTEFSFDTESYQPELIIKSWFVQNEQTEANQKLLDNMEVILEIEHPDDTVETLPVDPANEDGEFIIHYRPEQDGFYGASIIARSRTFQRQQNFSFKNIMPIEEEPIEELSPSEPDLPAEPEQVEPETLESPPAEVPAEAVAEEKPEEKEQQDLTKTLIYFGIANVVLIFFGLNGFLIYRHLKQNKTPPRQDDSKEE